ncbi:hypothetical protein TNCT_41991 [Trichonephila clavata]|uniref:Uncharacterized protein n=1 Tax=Trichonephila clavata TaxID=2740835 RepID=A0A8X6H815_TRICU|nr:hypothetical protein TNCT_41991 [Trichonephila clavata]
MLVILDRVFGIKLPLVLLDVLKVRQDHLTLIFVEKTLLFSSSPVAQIPVEQLLSLSHFHSVSHQRKNDIG